MSVGPWQIVLIALVILVLFGASRLGDIGKGLGEGIKNFKKGISADDDDDDEPESEPKEPKQLTEGRPAKSKSKSKSKSQSKHQEHS